MYAMPILVRTIRVHAILVRPDMVHL